MCLPAKNQIKIRSVGAFFYFFVFTNFRIFKKLLKNISLAKNSQIWSAESYYFSKQSCKKWLKNSISSSQKRTYVCSEKRYLLVQISLLHISLLQGEGMLQQPVHLGWSVWACHGAFPPQAAGYPKLAQCSPVGVFESKIFIKLS